MRCRFEHADSAICTEKLSAKQNKTLISSTPKLIAVNMYYLFTMNNGNFIFLDKYLPPSLSF